MKFATTVADDAMLLEMSAADGRRRRRHGLSRGTAAQFAACLTLSLLDCGAAAVIRRSGANVTRAGQSAREALLQEATSVDELDHRGFLGQRRQIYPDCSCMCCFVQQLTTLSEISGQPEKKCALLPDGSAKRCNEVCMINTQQDSILAPRAADRSGMMAIHYNRFCFYECKPPSCDAPPAAEVACSPLSVKEASEAGSAGDDNGKEVASDCY
eukprot:TRINITY_DN27157_c0_g1_i1.p1 TRINITY_DN27157_c0_g1~~TRINITY_DN27157_c0_g1_i1.p1  ORF type:complete len:213 (-),score=33.20 TRINITY_DN27157_c0_g1_i1:114-752(-)